MASFAEQLRRFTVIADANVQRVFVAATQQVKKSVRDGSELTGAPGQPVDTGHLKASWIERSLSATQWEITTSVAYAPVIEYNDRAFYDPRGTLPPPDEPNAAGGGTRHRKSTVGGNHSVRLTVAGWDRIVESVAARFRTDG